MRFALGVLAMPLAVPTALNVGGVDFTRGAIAVNGVGTPHILSPTGSLLERDALELAREDGERRLRQAFDSLRLPDGRTGATDPRLATLRGQLWIRATLAPPKYFSDGTAHQPVELDLRAALGAPTVAGGTTLSLTAPAGFPPCLELRVEREGSGAAFLAGLPGDAVPGLTWRPAPASPPPGFLPTTSPAVCVLRLGAAAPAPAQPPTAVEVIVP